MSNRVIDTAIASVLLVASMAGCDGRRGSPTGDDPDAGAISFDRRALLGNLGQNVVLPVYREFAQRAHELGAAVTGYCTALGTANEATAATAAQEAWKLAMDRWQVAEMMLFGPAAMDNRALRDRIYSWPVTSSCAVDQDVMLKRNDPAYDISARLTRSRGLDALEYVLFTASLASTCPPQVQPAGWDALSEADKRAARCAFAADAAADLAIQADALLAAWEPSQGNYVATLASAGDSGTGFGSAQDAINVVSDAMFYVDAEVKDMKLGEPAGIVLNSCSAVGRPCMAELESAFAHHGKENVIANLRGLHMVFTGDGAEATGGLGFDDFLSAAGAGELAQTMSSDIAAAIAAVEAIPGTLDQALTQDYQSVVAAHGAVKSITDNLKTQFLTVLGLELPQSAAADND